MKQLLRPIADDWVSACVQKGLASGEGLIWAVRDPIFKEEPIKDKGKLTGYQTVKTDSGIADKRLLILASEFSEILTIAKREGNTLSQIIRDCWIRAIYETCQRHPQREQPARMFRLWAISQNENS